VSADDDRAPSAPSDEGFRLGSPRTWPWPRPHTTLAVAGVGIVVAVNVVLAHIGLTADATAATTASSSASSATSPPRLAAQTGQASDAGEDAGAENAADAAAPAATDEPPNDDESPSHEKRDKPDKSSKGHTVQWAAERVCSTSHVDGLSRQIIEESRCLDANAFARVPARPNLTSAGHVFLYLDAPARDHLVRALDAHKDRVMKVHSALRTVAQQYLLSRWAAGKRCGIQLATRPGESNHETGLALDVADHGAWRAALEGEGFKWLGAIDRVHFDFVGPGATHHDGLDVRAFQRLWNRNHPDDSIGESGRIDAATEQRLKRSPANGFPIGARCGGSDDRRMARGGAGHGH
jgi:hypothetical protein